MPRDIASIMADKRRKQRPRQAVVNWMKREPRWYQEAIAEEWQRQTGESAADMLKRARGEDVAVKRDRVKSPPTQPTISAGETVTRTFWWQDI